MPPLHLARVHFSQLKCQGSDMLQFRYDSMKTLEVAGEKEVVAMTEDSTIGMKPPHRTLFLEAWKEFKKKARVNASSQGVAPQHQPQVHSVLIDFRCQQ
jgi:hypothetical protein